jgi:serine/threonine-protein kinase
MGASSPPDSGGTRTLEERLPGLRARLATRGIDVDALRLDSKGTIVPPPSTLPASPFARWPELVVEDRPGLPGPAQLRLGEPLAEGGMGVVHAATQLPLERPVAVKRPLQAGKPEDVAALVGEAFVVGNLEHPNLVPLHMVGLDGQGHPLLVMKYVEGQSWGELLLREDRLERLVHHLGVLMQVCNAVHYAHTRGIVHRDLKPSNVMVGAFGEVYVLDWGIAVSLRSEHRGRVPLARQAHAVVGTPAFMAPEMALADVEHIDERTDVYMLGGLLHVVLTGKAPHEADSLSGMLEAAFVSAPKRFGPEVAPELGAICNRAMSAEPAYRHASAAELRDALESYLQHRGSLELAATAMGRLGGLRELLAEGGEARPMLVHSLATEARFAFKEALRAWPDNPEAKRGYQDVLELTIDFELKRENRDAAATLLAVLPRPNEALAARLAALDEALSVRSERVKGLEKLRHEVDFGVDRSMRYGSVVVTGGIVVVGVTALVLRRVLGGREAAYPDLCGLMLLVAGGGSIASWRFFPPTNDVNRRLQHNFIASLWSGFVLVGLLWWGAAPFPSAAPLLLFHYAAAFALAAGAFERRLWATSLVFLLTSVVVLARPQYRAVALPVGTLCAFIALAKSWRPAAR